MLTGIKLFATYNNDQNAGKEAVVTVRDLTLMYTAAEEVPPTPVFVRGDMTGDGVLNMMDALLLYSGFSAGTLTEDQIATVADFNNDGQVNMFDPLLLYSSIA